MKFLAAASFLLAGCVSAFASPETAQPSGWDANVKLSEAVDTNSDPRIVEINLKAEIKTVKVGPGVEGDLWTYNGGLPGPVIRANVGDRLIVHFTNALPQSTTIHWHGVQVPIQMDGVPGISQDPVE